MTLDKFRSANTWKIFKATRPKSFFSDAEEWDASIVVAFSPVSLAFEWNYYVYVCHVLWYLPLHPAQAEDSAELGIKASPLRHFRISAGIPPWPRAFPDASDPRGSFSSSLVGSLYSSFRTEGHRACVLSTLFYGSESWGAYHLTENFGNSGWKLNGKVPTENWGERFEVVRSFRFVQTKRNVAYH